MPLFSFIHTADIHLDSPLRNLSRYEGAPVEALRGAARRAFENLVDLALSPPVDFLLIAGDLYDGDWPDYNTGLFFISQMAKLKEAGVRVFITAGNHDAASRMTRSLRLPGNVHMFRSDRADTVRLEHLKVAVHGQSFSTPAVKQNLAENFPDAVTGCFNIALLHTAVNGREGHEPYAPCALPDLLAAGYDYWALGHVHQHEILHRDPFILFPGNIQGRHIRETGPKGCMRVTVDDTGKVLPEFRPLDVIRWHHQRVDVSEAEDGFEAVEIATDAVAPLPDENGGVPAAVRIELTGSPPAYDSLTAHPGRWGYQLRSSVLDATGGRVWIEKIRFRLEPPKQHAAIPQDGPFQEIFSLLEEAPHDPELTALMADAAAPLQKRLPREFKETSGYFSEKPDQWIEEALRTVGPMLLERLMKPGSPQ